MKCSACGALIIFKPHERTGIVGPLTARDDGNIVLNADGTYHLLRKGETRDGQHYLNHFANCPAAPHFHRDHHAQSAFESGRCDRCGAKVNRGPFCAKCERETRR